MSATPQNPDDQELDLSQISRKIGHFLKAYPTEFSSGFYSLKEISFG